MKRATRRTRRLAIWGVCAAAGFAIGWRLGGRDPLTVRDGRLS